MAQKKDESKRPIESYEHKDKQRANNPPVGLVTPDTDPDAGAKKAYAYDPAVPSARLWNSDRWPMPSTRPRRWCRGRA